jgi:micrococcal nuclease
MSRRGSRTWFVPLWAGAALVGTAYGVGWFGSLPTSAATNPYRTSFGYCHTGGGTNCVVDGDTIWLGGEKIRVADIDAPETHPARCAEEQTLGDRATRRLQQLLNTGAVSLQAIDRDRDRYGRKLRIVLVDGRSVGDRLVDEGLARWYAGGRRPWC